MTGAEYEANIPNCCMFRTFDDHSENLLLCESVKAGPIPKLYRCVCECSIYADDRDKFRVLMKETLK